MPSSYSSSEGANQNDRHLAFQFHNTNFKMLGSKFNMKISNNIAMHQSKPTIFLKDSDNTNFRRQTRQ